MKTNTPKNKKGGPRAARSREVERDISSIVNESRKVLSKPAQRYMECVIDPLRSKPAKIPTGIGGYTPSSSARRYKIAGQAVIGSAGVGYICLHPGSYSGFGGGPFNNRNVGSYSQSNFVGPSLPILASTTGVQEFQMPTPYTAAAADPSALIWRVVAASIEVIPVSSALSQNGSITLYETPSHQAYTSQINLIPSLPNARRIRGVQTGTLQEKIVINQHPTSTQQAGAVDDLNDFSWNLSDTAANITALHNGGIVVALAGDAATAFDFTATVVFELTGFSVKGQSPCCYDSRGMDLVMNTFAHKRRSGWVGKPRQAHDGYFTRLWHIGAKLTSGMLSSMTPGYVKTLGSVALQAATELAGI